MMDISQLLELIRTASSVLIIVPIWLGFRTYKRNVEKIRIDKANSNYKTNYELLTYFNSHREDMEAVFLLRDTELKDLLSNRSSVESANSICLVFHLLGSLIEAEESDSNKEKITEMFCQMFYYAIPHTRVILNEYIGYIRHERHPAYWLGYDQLVVRTVIRHRTNEFIHLDTGDVGNQAMQLALPLTKIAYNNGLKPTSKTLRARFLEWLSLDIMFKNK